MTAGTLRLNQYGRPDHKSLLDRVARIGERLELRVLPGLRTEIWLEGYGPITHNALRTWRREGLVCEVAIVRGKTLTLERIA